MQQRPFLDFLLGNFGATMAVNVTGTLLSAQHAARLMMPRAWKWIISIAAVARMRSVGCGRTAHDTSKAALIGLMRQIATELAEAGITANGVASGAVDTPLTEVLHSAEFRARALTKIASPARLPGWRFPARQRGLPWLP